MMESSLLVMTCAEIAALDEESAANEYSSAETVESRDRRARWASQQPTGLQRRRWLSSKWKPFGGAK